jgi:hypothetical protein
MAEPTAEHVSADEGMLVHGIVVLNLALELGFAVDTFKQLLPAADPELDKVARGMLATLRDRSKYLLAIVDANMPEEPPELIAQLMREEWTVVEGGRCDDV